jgi:hypothetical protein
MASLSGLPDELLVYLYSYLPISSAISLRRTCQACRQVFTEELWRLLVERDYPGTRKGKRTWQQTLAQLVAPRTILLRNKQVNKLTGRLRITADTTIEQLVRAAIIIHNDSKWLRQSNYTLEEVLHSGTIEDHVPWLEFTYESKGVLRSLPLTASGKIEAPPWLLIPPTRYSGNTLAAITTAELDDNLYFTLRSIDGNFYFAAY